MYTSSKPCPKKRTVSQPKFVYISFLYSYRVNWSQAIRYWIDKFSKLKHRHIPDPCHQVKGHPRPLVPMRYLDYRKNKIKSKYEKEKLEG